MKYGVVPKYWKATCIIPIHKENANYGGISILNMSGRVLISRVIESTKGQVAEEQGVRSGRGYVDQIFVLKQLVEKYTEKKKYLHILR